MTTIEPRSGTSFTLTKGQYLCVQDIQGMQVSDMVLFAANDTREHISSGKTLDFEGTIRLTTGNYIWSNRSNKLLEIVYDDVKQHDFLLAPCSKETFMYLYDDHDTTHSCKNNLECALAPYGIKADEIPTAFNIFMNVNVGLDGKIEVLPPISKAGDIIIFKALTDVIVALTACSAKDSNGGSFKPIGFQIMEKLNIPENQKVKPEEFGMDY
ncbi:DUF1989 domain-containing protein [Flavobacterium sp. ASW18X]|uniref:DUF1989 domain-containing protein n=1 Tax=Flavobacterium sp. ASW18X TaxID=2572595 RepID=UPI0010AE786B|nr:urea carboxylase-associated family protein [Flavobacterium sp. ASW18X]TKD66039.1 urea carboxylase-associated family protein [Flavobacterium sp. ASW18X]